MAASFARSREPSRRRVRARHRPRRIRRRGAGRAGGGGAEVAADEVEDAALIDRLTRLGAFVKVVLPLAKAGVLTTVIFTLTLVMQEFVYGLTFITTSSHYTVSVGVPTFLVRGDVYFWGSLMAACLIVSIPIAVLYNFFVDRFVAGITGGAIK